MSKIDSLVKKVDLFERLANFGDRSSFLKKLSQQAAPSGGFTEEQVQQYYNLDNFGNPKPPPGFPAVPKEDKSNPLTPPHAMNAPAPHEQGHATPMAPIAPNDQKLISSFLVQHNAGIPISKNDGKLGPETRQALTNVKNYLRQPNMSDAEVINLLKMPEKVNQMVASFKQQTSPLQAVLDRSNQQQATQQPPQQVARK